MKSLLLLLLSFNAYGAEFIIEQGNSDTWFANPNYYTDNKYTAIAIRTEGAVFYEAIQGSWMGESNARFFGGSVGVKSSGKFFAEASLGGVKLVRPKTNQLDGKYQFLISTGLGYRIDEAFVYAKLRHLSNAGTLGNNRGMDFRLIGIGVAF